MRQLMISLDKNILWATSAAAQHMIVYGQKNEIFILIPSKEKNNLDLSSSVHVSSVGGNKLMSFFRLLSLGAEICQKKSIDLITVQDPFFIGLVGIWLQKKSGRPLEVQVHGDFFGSGYYHFWKRWLGLWVSRRAQKVRTVGERVKNGLVRAGLDEKKIEVRPIFTDVAGIKSYQPAFDLHNRYPGYEKIFLALCRWEPEKNLIWLIDVFSQAVKERPNFLLLIVGNGREAEKISFRVKKSALEKNVKLEGWTSDPWSYLKTADCLLLSSLSEGYGLVAMEAVAAGTPIIMTDVGVANHELKPGTKVKVVSVGDREGFTKAILSL